MQQAAPTTPNLRVDCDLNFQNVTLKCYDTAVILKNTQKKSKIFKFKDWIHIPKFRKSEEWIPTLKSLFILNGLIWIGFDTTCQIFYQLKLYESLHIAKITCQIIKRINKYRTYLNTLFWLLKINLQSLYIWVLTF